MAFLKCQIAAAIVSVLATAAAAQTEVPSGLARAWPETDFTRTTVDLREIMSGGVPRDGIPAITDPEMVAIDRSGDLSANEPVMTVEIDGSTPRAYPIRYLTWHEVVNDRIDGIPVAVTFCPLCNSGLVFDRRMGGATLEFGVSGLLRFSDLVMYDRQTFSLWQQFSGEAIVGQMSGAVLNTITSWTEPWGTFAERQPDGLVMAEPRGFRRQYGNNLYVGYDSSKQPFLYRGDPPPHGVPPLARVVRVGTRAWPLERVAKAGTIAEHGVRIEWSSGMASALDAASIAESRDVGAIRVQDAETGRDLPHEVVFAFAFHAFHPDGTWMLGD